MKIKRLENVHFDDFDAIIIDYRIGEKIGNVIGDTFIDCNLISPREQWTRVAKALRIHGLKIVEKE